jgi:N-acetylglucosamine kinase-like BadF-type ATPase
MHAQPLLIGLDAGATRTVAAGRCQEAAVRRDGPGANLQRDGLDACATRLADLARDAIASLPEADQLFLCAGVAGAGRPDEQRALGDRLQKHLDGAATRLAVEVTCDGTLALEGALPDGASGVVAVAGTGSALLARTRDGNVLRAGGWGHAIGDPGGATALGRDALAAVADDFDGGEPTVLRHRLAEEHGVHAREDLRRLLYHDRIDPARLAPLVIAAAAVPDWVATRILQQQVNRLAARAAWLASRAAEEGAIEPQAALVGGLVRSVHYREVLAEAILRHLPRWRIVRPAAAPEEAALARAARLAEAA